jgi:DNA topoisomerase I
MPASVDDEREGLLWGNDRQPGIRRIPTPRGRVPFGYRDRHGLAVRDTATLERIRRLAIPPAWTDVWICADERGHLQATGRDARGRKQYRYHPAWIAARGQHKFDQLLRFGTVLPRIRSRVQRALQGPAEPTRSRVLATIVRLLDRTCLRIGNPEYVRANGSFGLSTLRDRHARVEGDEVRLSFVGKSGVRHQARLADRRLARIVRRCRELPGQELFQYCGGDDGDAMPRPIGSADVNEWLAQAAGCRVTAKDFRTWHASVLALQLVLQCRAQGAEPRRPQDLLAAVARRLGNTVAVCRQAYIHPQVLALVQTLGDRSRGVRLQDEAWVLQGTRSRTRGLDACERQLLALLRAQQAGSRH